jgi:hypothetical protein
MNAVFAGEKDYRADQTPNQQRAILQQQHCHGFGADGAQHFNGSPLRPADKSVFAYFLDALPLEQNVGNFSECP